MNSTASGSPATGSANQNAILFVIALTLAAVGSLAWKAFDNLAQERRAFASELQMQSQSLAAMFETALESAEQTLTGVTYRLEYNAGREGITLDLRKRMLRSPSLKDLRSFDGRGVLRERAALTPLASSNLPEWIQTEMAQGRSTGVGSEAGELTLYRTARDQTGRLLGSVAATLAIGHFQGVSYLSAYAIARDSFLIDPDGQLLMDVEDGNFPSGLRQELAWANKINTQFSGQGSLVREVENTFIVIQQLRNHSIRLVQIAPGEVVYTRWRNDLLLSLVPAALILVAALFFVRYLRSTDRVNRQLSSELHRMKLLIEQSPVPIVITDLLASVAYVNPAFTTSTGYTRAEILGSNPRLLQSGKTDAAVYRALWDSLSLGKPWRGQLRNRKKDGSEFWEESFVAPLRDIAGNTTHYFAVKIDISARMAAQEQLLQAQAHLQHHARDMNTILENSTVGIVFVKDRRQVWGNARMAEMFGYSVEECRDQSTRMYYLSDAAYDDLGLQGYATIARGERFISECQMRHKTRDAIWVRLSGKAVDPLDIGAGSIWVFEDISEQKRLEGSLKLAASVFTSAREGILITDVHGAIVDVNQTFSDITGYSRAEVLGQNPRMLQSGRQGPEFYATLWTSLAEKGHWYGEVWNRRKNGSVYAEMLAISTVHDAAGQAEHYVALFSDITSIKAHQQQLEHIAHFDALTQLPNRVLLADRLHQAIIHCQRRALSLAVVFLDLDGFKLVNDRYGHASGDTLLVELSQRMKTALRECDTLARIGGDEFVAILVDLEHPQDCEQVLARMLLAAAEPLSVDGNSLKVSASMGVTLCPQDGTEADMLMRQADQAMYAAKQAGKNRYHMFDFAQDAAIKSQRESIGRIRQALQDQEFVLYYQPKVNMRSNRVVGAEALIRWQHPAQGLLEPAQFLPVIEDHPLSIVMGEWVIATALDQLAAWSACGPGFVVSVNIGARQLQDAHFCNAIQQHLLAHEEVSPRCLQLEILETNALQDVDKVGAVITACQDLGVSFALDDFGTGYSSLTYLKHLPAEVLKIDQSFVHDMLVDASDLAIVNGVIGLAKAFGREVIAEGVETAAHRDLLLSIDCELAQGYGIARPMPAADFLPWMERWHARPEWVR